MTRTHITEILFMCITDYFKLLSCSCAIKTLNLKFLTESKVKKKFLWFNGGKNDWRTRNSIYVFLRIIRCHNGIGYEEKSRRKIWTWEWLLKRNERGAYIGTLNKPRLTDKEDFRKYLRMNTGKINENNFFYHISLLPYMFSQNATRDFFVTIALTSEL